MVRAIVLVASLALLLPALAMAQEHRDEHHGGPPQRGGPPPGQPHGPPPGPPQRGLPPGALQHQTPTVQQQQLQQQHFRTGPVTPGPAGSNRVFVPGQAAPTFVPGRAGPQFGPSGQAQFHYHGHAFNPVHVQPYVYPRGWGYRRWGVGAVLPPIFLAPTYYYTSWATLGLDPPPPGTQWVRYGPDLLLVDITTGEVIEVVPDVFYE